MVVVVEGAFIVSRTFDAAGIVAAQGNRQTLSPPTVAGVAALLAADGLLALPASTVRKISCRAAAEEDTQ